MVSRLRSDEFCADPQSILLNRHSQHSPPFHMSHAPLCLCTHSHPLTYSSSHLLILHICYTATRNHSCSSRRCGARPLAGPALTRPCQSSRASTPTRSSTRAAILAERHSRHQAMAGRRSLNPQSTHTSLHQAILSHRLTLIPPSLTLFRSLFRRLSYLFRHLSHLSHHLSSPSRHPLAPPSHLRPARWTSRAHSRAPYRSSQRA